MIHAFEEYLSISNDFDIRGKKIDAYIESASREFAINVKQSELKVIEESGTDDDLLFLYEAAEDGYIVKLKAAIKAVIDAFVKFMTDLKDKVVRIIVRKESREQMKKIEKKVKMNPFLAKKKVKINNTDAELKCINEFKSKCDKETAKELSKIKSVDDIRIGALRDTFDSNYKKVIIATAGAVTITLVALVAKINKQMEDLPSVLTNIEKENSAALQKFMDSAISDETAATCKAAMTAAANFRTQLAKKEANAHVDALMQNISAAKKALKIDKTVQVNIESAYDDYGYDYEESVNDFDAEYELAMLEYQLDDSSDFEEYEEEVNDILGISGYSYSDDALREYEEEANDIIGITDEYGYDYEESVDADDLLSELDSILY